MTRCDLATNHLTEYVGGELGALERAIVDEHLAECAACRAELAREKKLRVLMAGLPDVACPDDVLEAIHDAVDAEPVQVRRPSVLQTWSSTLAAASLVAAAVLLVMVLPRPTQVTPSGPDDSPTATITTTDASTSWTQEELDQAREDFQWALAFTANVIERTEKQTIIDVMRRLQEEANAGFRDRGTSTSTGGRG